METGTIGSFDIEIGEGWIIPDAGGPDVFVHYSEIAVQGSRDIYAGWWVSYDTEEVHQGPMARNVEILQAGSFTDV